MGRAPIARRMPISVVRSFTVTIMMLLTPIAPASKVPKPTIHPGCVCLRLFDVLSKTDNRGGKCRKAADEESPGFTGQDAG